MRRLIPTLYWISIGMLAVGAVLLVLDGDDAQLDHVGEIIAGLAWPPAAAGALLDTVRHQRRRNASRGGGAAPSHGGGDEAPRLRSEA